MNAQVLTTVRVGFLLSAIIATSSVPADDTPKQTRSSCNVDFVVAGPEANVNGFAGAFTNSQAFKDSDCTDVKDYIVDLRHLFPMLKKDFKELIWRCNDPHTELILSANRISETVPLSGYVVLRYPCNDPSSDCVSRRCPDGYQKCAKDRLCATLC